MQGTGDAPAPLQMVGECHCDGGDSYLPSSLIDPQNELWVLGWQPRIKSMISEARRPIPAHTLALRLIVLWSFHNHPRFCTNATRKFPVGIAIRRERFGSAQYLGPLDIVERSPQCPQRLLCRGHYTVGTFGVLLARFEPAPPRRPVHSIGFFVHFEIGERFR